MVTPPRPGHGHAARPVRNPGRQPGRVRSVWQTGVGSWAERRWSVCQPETSARRRATPPGAPLRRAADGPGCLPHTVRDQSRRDTGRAAATVPDGPPAAEHLASERNAGVDQDFCRQSRRTRYGIHGAAPDRSTYAVQARPSTVRRRRGVPEAFGTLREASRRVVQSGSSLGGPGRAPVIGPRTRSGSAFDMTAAFPGGECIP